VPSASPSAFEPTGTITVWQGEEPDSEKYFGAKFAEYEQLHPGVTIKTLYIPGDSFEAKLLTAYSSGNGPDIAKVGGWDMPTYIDKDYLAPLDPNAFGKADLAGVGTLLEPGSLTPLTFDSKVYGFPIDFNSMSLWYRKDRFSAAGLDPNKPPTTWEQVQEYDKALTNPDRSKVGFQPATTGDPIFAEMQFLPLINGLGGSLLNADNTKGNLETPEGIKALTYYAQEGNAKLKAPNAGFSLFADGTAAMILSGRFTSAFLPTMNSALVYGENFATATIPAWEGKSPVASGYTWAWTVTKTSQNQASAWDLISWLNTPDRVDQQLKDTGLVTPLLGWTTRSAGSDEPSKVMVAQLPYTTDGPQIVQWAEVMNTLATTMDAVNLGTMSPEEGAQSFDSKVDSILQ
jgi:multiple sugar transport system substrate-binding protein